MKKCQRYIGSIGRSALVSSNSIVSVDHSVAFSRLDFPSPLSQVRLCSLRFAFPCGFGEKKRKRESKSARKMGRVKEWEGGGGGGLSFYFLRDQKRKSRFAPKPHGNACYVAALRSTRVGAQAHFTKSGW